MTAIESDWTVFQAIAQAPGVATVTQGPGLTNSVTSLVVSHRRGSPVLLLAGEAPTGDRHNPQQFDQLTLAKLVAGKSGRVDSTRSFDEVVAEALRTVRSGFPYVLNLPGDMQQTSLGSSWRYSRRYATAQHVCAESEVGDAVVGALVKAERPAILAGRGAVTSGARNTLQELAELLGAPLTTTLLANGLFAGHSLEAGCRADSEMERQSLLCFELLRSNCEFFRLTYNFRLYFASIFY